MAEESNNACHWNKNLDAWIMEVTEDSPWCDQVRVSCEWWMLALFRRMTLLVPGKGFMWSSKPQMNWHKVIVLKEPSTIFAYRTPSWEMAKYWISANTISATIQTFFTAVHSPCATLHQENLSKLKLNYCLLHVTWHKPHFHSYFGLIFKMS